jgi:hypothetical protein
MLLPEQFYRISETDRAVSPPEIRYIRTVISGAVPLHAATLYTVPGDRHAILQSCCVLLNVDAGASARHVRQVGLLLLDGGGNELAYIVNRQVPDVGTHNVMPDLAAGVTNLFQGVASGSVAFMGWTLPCGGVILPAGSRLVGVTRLSAAPTAHIATWDVSLGLGPLGGLLR